MIKSAEEFLSLMRSEEKEDYERFRNDEAPLDVWEDIISRYPLASEWVARNRKSPTKILEKLARDKRSLVRSEVASVRRIPESLQLKLAHDPEYSVRRALAYNAKAAVSVLKLLAKDKENTISAKAKERLNEKNV